jgi:prepilin-type N-terminal cleavage/methylation domain-containing protein
MASRRAVTLLEMLVVIAIFAVLIGLILPAVMQVRAVAARTRCSSNLRNIGLALQNHHASFNRMPPGLRGIGSDYPWFGWEGRILPFVEQDLVWQRAKSDYAPHPHLPVLHHAGLSTPIRLYVCPADNRVQAAEMSGRGFVVAFTSYLGVLGEDVGKQDGVFYCNSKIRLADVLDGTSNTLCVGERPPSDDLNYGWWYAGQGMRSTGA